MAEPEKFHLVKIPKPDITVKMISHSRMKSKKKAPFFKNPSPPVAKLAQVPTPPATWDWTKGDALRVPILGNDRYGDCEYVAACAGVESMTYLGGTQAEFTADEVIQAYLRLAGGDNGLDTDTMLGEWGRGLCGGPHKILDKLQINPTDKAAMNLAGWAFGGCFFTLGVPDAWIASAGPGAVWDAGQGVSANDRNGHAIWFNARQADGFLLNTWAIHPEIRITDAGIAVCDPEAHVVFSRDWFDTSGKAPNGLMYADLAALWQQCGGRQLPPWDGPPPPPPPPPPTPTPTLQTLIDNVFKGIEAVFAWSPGAVQLLRTLNTWIDLMLFGDSPTAKRVKASGPIWTWVNGLLQNLIAAEAGHPIILLVLVMLQAELQALIGNL